MQYQFIRDVTVEGVPHKSGDIINEADIPLGSKDSLLATWLTSYEPPESGDSETAFGSPAADQTLNPKRKGK